MLGHLQLRMWEDTEEADLVERDAVKHPLHGILCETGGSHGSRQGRGRSYGTERLQF